MDRLQWNQDWRLISKSGDIAILFKNLYQWMESGLSILTAVKERTETPADLETLIDELVLTFEMDDGQSHVVPELLKKLERIGVLLRVRHQPRVLFVNSVARQPETSNTFNTMARFCAILNQLNYDAFVFDLALETSDQPFITHLQQNQYDLIGFSTFTPGFDDTVRRIAVARTLNRSAKIILGGPHATLMYETILRDHAMIDAVAVGESETTIADICSFLLGRAPVGDLKGIAYRRDGEIIVRSPTWETDLARIPLPDAASVVNWAPGTAMDHYRIKTSRGCAASCSFCAANVLQGCKIRYLPMSSIISEMKWAQETFQPAGFYICDDNFTMSRKQVLDFCDTISSTLPKARWLCNARIDDIEEQLVSRMFDAGCYAVMIGIETLNDETIQKIGKRKRSTHVSSVSHVLDRIDLCLRAGLFVNLSLIIGLPGETQDDIEHSFSILERFLREHPHRDHVVISTPFIALLPGTQLTMQSEQLGYRWCDTRSESLLLRPTAVSDSLNEEQMIVLSSYFGKEYKPI